MKLKFFGGAESMISVVQVTDKNSEYVPVLHKWMYEWWAKNEGFSHRKLDVYIEHSLCERTFPQTYVMTEDGAPIGMYQFTLSDIDVRPDIYPWLINVYICEEYRGRGLMNALMKSIFKNAEKSGIYKLYLYTTHENLYEKYGWQFIETFESFMKSENMQKLYSIQLNKNKRE